MKAERGVPGSAAGPGARGYLLALGGTAFWASTGVLIRYLSTRYALPPLVLAFWRDLLAAATLAVGVYVLRQRRAPWAAVGPHILFLLAYGFVLAAFNALWTTSVALNGAAVATVLAYSAPAFTALLGWGLLGEALGLRKIAAVVLSVLGCIAVSGAYNPAVWRVAPLALGVGLLSGVGFSAYTLMGKTSSKRGLEAWGVTFWGFAFGSVFLLLFQVVAGRVGHLLWLGSSLSGWAVLAFLAIGPTVGGYGLYTASLRYLPASVANLITTIEPPLTVIFAALWLGERLTGIQLVGGALILAAVLMVRSGREG